MPLKLVRRHGSEVWYLRGTVAGQRVDESTRITDKAQAEAFRARREWELQQGAVFGRRATATFLTAAVSYMEAGGETRFVDRLLDHFKTTPLKNIDQIAIDDAATKLYPGRAPGTINRQVHGPMSAILRHAAERGLTELRAISRPRQPKGNMRWLSPAEAEALLVASAPHLRPLLTFMLYTGARCSEALLLEWRSVDLKRAHVMFLDTKSKEGGKNRGVPLHPAALAALKGLYAKAHKPEICTNSHSRVFLTQAGRPYSIEKGDDHGGQIKTAFKAAVRRSGIPHCRPHDLRHTWATWHYGANRDLKALMELGGWDDEASVHRYTHVNAGHLAPSIANLPHLGEIRGTRAAE